MRLKGKRSEGSVQKISRGAITVLDVPIHNQDVLHTVTSLRIAGADGCIIEKTKAHRAIRRRMMSRWTNQRECAAPIFFHDKIGRLRPQHRSLPAAQRRTTSAH